MNPDEMEYESSNIDIAEEDIDTDIVLGLETATDSNEADGDYEYEEEQDGEEEQTLIEEEDESGDGRNVRVRLVHEDEDGDDEDGATRAYLTGVPTRHFLSIPGGMPFRVEILGLSGHGSDPRRNLIKVPEPVPNPEGQKLMRDGHFGTEEWKCYPSRPNRNHKSYPQYIRLLEREIGAYRGERARIGNQLLAQRLLPKTKADFVMHYDSRCYSGQFSQDGNFFYSCSQDLRVHMYDTSNPYNWDHYKTVSYPGGSWTITDATLSPDNRMLAYSSIASTVYVTDTSTERSETVPLNFAAAPRNDRRADRVANRSFGIWSIRFSGDGREMVAGASDNNLYVYDIKTQTPVMKLSGHHDDVNAVCFADVDSPHILFSGSDDTTLKVWDRRSMNTGREVGVFCGHLEGLTYIDSKGDGRYVLSNGKDQTMKLWDIRKMMDPAAFDNLKRYNYSMNYDYRSEPYYYPPARHPNDCSLVTYRGHSVLRTLIRCHFSPPTSSGSRYVYTGSADGKVYIYNLDATIASVINVCEATLHTRPWDENHMHNYWGTDGTRWKTLVRDASWHPNAGVLAASSWNGFGAGTGSVTLHSWGAEEEEGGAVRQNCWGKKDMSLYIEREEEDVSARRDARAERLRRRYM